MESPPCISMALLPVQGIRDLSCASVTARLSFCHCRCEPRLRLGSRANDTIQWPQAPMGSAPNADASSVAWSKDDYTDFAHRIDAGSDNAFAVLFSPVTDPYSDQLTSAQILVYDETQTLLGTHGGTGTYTLDVTIDSASETVIGIGYSNLSVEIGDSTELVDVHASSAALTTAPKNTTATTGAAESDPCAGSMANGQHRRHARHRAVIGEDGLLYLGFEADGCCAMILMIFQSAKRLKAVMLTTRSCDSTATSLYILRRSSRRQFHPRKSKPIYSTMALIVPSGCVGVTSTPTSLDVSTSWVRQTAPSRLPSQHLQRWCYYMFWVISVSVSSSPVWLVAISTARLQSAQ